MDWGQLAVAAGAAVIRSATFSEYAKTVAAVMAGDPSGNWADDAGQLVTVLGGPDRAALISALHAAGIGVTRV